MTHAERERIEAAQERAFNRGYNQALDDINSHCIGTSHTFYVCLAVNKLKRPE